MSSLEQLQKMLNKRPFLLYTNQASSTKMRRNCLLLLIPTNKSCRLVCINEYSIPEVLIYDKIRTVFIRLQAFYIFLLFNNTLIVIQFLKKVWEPLSYNCLNDILIKLNLYFVSFSHIF